MKKFPGKLNNDNSNEKTKINIIELINNNISKFLMVILIIQLLMLGSMINLFIKVNQSYKKLEYKMELDKEFEIDVNKLELEKHITELIEEIKNKTILSLQLEEVNLVNETQIKQWINEAVNESLNNELNEINKDFGEKFEDMTSYFGDKVKETIENINEKVNKE